MKPLSRTLTYANYRHMYLMNILKRQWTIRLIQAQTLGTSPSFTRISKSQSPNYSPSQEIIHPIGRLIRAQTLERKKKNHILVQMTSNRTQTMWCFPLRCSSSSTIRTCFSDSGTFSITELSIRSSSAYSPWSWEMPKPRSGWQVS